MYGLSSRVSPAELKTVYVYLEKSWSALTFEYYRRKSATSSNTFLELLFIGEWVFGSKALFILFYSLNLACTEFVEDDINANRYYRDRVTWYNSTSLFVVIIKLRSSPSNRNRIIRLELLLVNLLISFQLPAHWVLYFNIF